VTAGGGVVSVVDFGVEVEVDVEADVEAGFNGSEDGGNDVADGDTGVVTTAVVAADGAG